MAAHADADGAPAGLAAEAAVSAYDPADPSTWTSKRQAAFMGSSLKAFLATVPTEVTKWSTPDLLPARQVEADQIAASMDAVYQVMDEAQ